MVMQTQSFREQFNLAIVSGAWYPIIDFLHQDDIRTAVRQRFHNSLWSVAPVKPSNSLVNIVCNDAKLHRYPINFRK